MVHTSFVILLMAATAAQAGDLAARYSDLVAKLDTTQAESFCSARASLRELMPQTNMESRGRMFRSYRELLLRAVSSERADDPGVASQWLRCGFAAYESEGITYLTTAPDTLLEFAPQLQPDLEAYVRFNAKETATPIVDDATLLISWEQLRETLARWEDFARRYARLPETGSEVTPEIERLARIYLLGIDNTPAFERSTNLVDLELLASWKVFYDANKNSRYHDLMAALLPSVEQHGGKLDCSDQPPFEKAGLASNFVITLGCATP